MTSYLFSDTPRRPLRLGAALLPLLCLLASCRDTASIEPLRGQSRLVLYAFPTVGDTLDIRVSLTRPVHGPMPRLAVEALTCTVNGVPGAVSLLERDTLSDFPVHTYRVVAPFRVGDRVSVAVQTQGLPTATAATTIPRLTPLTALRLDTIYRKDTDYRRLSVTFRDAEGPDYYAVRVLGRSCSLRPRHADEGSAPLPPDTICTLSGFVEVETTLEPMLNNGSPTEGAFAEEMTNFYGGMYIFSDVYAPSSEPTLRLYMRPWSANQFQAHLYTLSPEYYRMLRSLNDSQNNDMGGYGLSFVSTTYTNVQGGFGCVGAYALNVSGWY